MFIDNLNDALDAYHLLKHPFYKAWNAGELTQPILQQYATQYFHNVNAFPRYISGVHSRCDSISDRKVLLENLIDEERGDKDHPELWLRFAESLGLKRDEVLYSVAELETKELINGFLSLVNHSYPSGLGALFAYEQQVPAVAISKIEGLKKFYGYDDKNQGLEFFKVHIGADEWHSQECLSLLNNLSAKDQVVAHEAATQVAQLLWKFLDGVCRLNGICGYANHC